ncbi:hypothetical protein Tco_1189834, partial [Tanacetum coccineum]
MAQDLWALLAKWWGLDIPLCVNISWWFDWLEVSRIPSKARSFLDGVGGTLLWTIWNYRNRLIFSSSPPKKSVLMDSIVSQSFLWISSRNPKFMCSTKVGGNMSRKQAWKEVVDKVLSRLSRWKMNLLSIGGRLILFLSPFDSLMARIRRVTKLLG